MWIILETNVLHVEMRLPLISQVLSKRYGSSRHAQGVEGSDPDTGTRDLLDPFFCPNGMWVQRIPVTVAEILVFVSMYISHSYYAFAGRGVSLQISSILDKIFCVVGMTSICPRCKYARGMRMKVDHAGFDDTSSNIAMIDLQTPVLGCKNILQPTTASNNRLRISRNAACAEAHERTTRGAGGNSATAGTPVCHWETQKLPLSPRRIHS